MGCKFRQNSNFRTYMKIIILSLAGLFLLQSCASRSGVMRIGENKYLISNQASTGFNAGDMKPAMVSEAADFCSSNNKSFELISLNKNAGPYILGNYPKADIQFMCLEKNGQ